MPFLSGSRAGLRFRGAWSTTTTYSVNDTVTWGGSSYIVPGPDVPAVGTPPTGTASDPGSDDTAVNTGWSLVAKEGTTGPAGAAGPAGPAGPQGPAGQDAAASTWRNNADSTAIIPVDNADSWVVGSDRTGQDAADVTKDARAFFHKVKAAFRAGRVAGTKVDAWDDVNVGDRSFAVGNGTIASGANAFAEGDATTASGISSHAEGITTRASGQSAHAEGAGTVASGTDSHAEGSTTTASGASSHAEGVSTTASGAAAHAEGNLARATASNTHAQGENTLASGYAAHAEGIFTTASGAASHAEGHRAVASRQTQWAHAGGRFAADGDAQVSMLVLRKQTADAVASLLTVDTAAAGFLTDQTNVLTLTANRVHKFRCDVAARRSDVTGEAAGWEFSGLIARDATGSAYFVGNVEGRAWGTVAAAAWDVTLSINTTDATNNYLAITATGQVGKTIRWVANLETVEVG